MVSLTEQIAAQASQAGKSALTHMHKNENVRASSERWASSERSATYDGRSSSPSLGGGSAAVSSVTFSASSRIPDGLIGCPEIQRDELMNLEKFEALEKRYADYSDRAETWHRKKMPMAQCFHKFLPDVVLSLNSLLGRSEAVRRKFPGLRNRDYQLDREFLLSLQQEDFSNLYKELLTSKTIMASDVIADLISTPFQKKSKDKEQNLAHMIIQASSAFREKLYRQPTQTVSKCTRIQLRDAFVKMVLGKEEANLADFSECLTWEDAVKVMMDMEGSGQGVAFLQRIQAHQLEKLPDKFERKEGKTKSEKTRGEEAPQPDSEESWKKRFEELADTIEHNDTEMKGHTDSYRDRVFRLLQLQDARRRDAQMRAMERGKSLSDVFSGGGRAQQSQAAGGHSHKDDGYRSSRNSHKGRFNRNDERDFRGGYRDRDRHRNGNDSSGDEMRDSQSNRRGSYKEQREERKDQREDSRSPAKQREHHQSTESRSQLGASGPLSHPPARLCYNCREEGHLASDCPHPPRRSGAGGGGRNGNERNNSEERRSKSPSKASSK